MGEDSDSVPIHQREMSQHAQAMERLNLSSSGGSSTMVNNVFEMLNILSQKAFCEVVNG